MTKKELIRIITKLLKSDGDDLAFLRELDTKDLEVLTGYIRERIDRTGTR